MQGIGLRTGWGLALLMMALSFSACSSVDGEDPAEADAPVTCETNQECRGGEACRDGLCRTICSSHDDCKGARSRCAVVQGYCVECLGPDDCAEGSMCALGQCVPAGEPICLAGQASCSDNGSRVLTCSSDGMRLNETACGANERCRLTPQGVQCQRVEGTPACTPGTSGCRSDSVAWRCTSDGTAERETTCAETEVCEEGACVPFLCEPGVERCRGDRVVTCDDDGDEVVVVSCPDTQLCQDADFGCTCRDAFCQERVCMPGATRCQGAATERCDSGGLRWESPVPCAAGQRCEDGSCVGGGGEICTPGARSCQGDVLRSCRSDGSGFDVEEDCGLDGGRCVNDGGARCADESPVCTPNTRTCVSNNRSVEVCNASGTGTTTTPCAAQETCVNGNCVLATGTTCEDLSCGAEQRRCIDETPAFCGGCLPGYVERSGACVDACSAGPGEATHVGCEFWPVFVDQDSGSDATRSLGIVVTNPSSSRTVTVQVTTSSGDAVDSFSLSARQSETVEVRVPTAAARGTRRDRLTWRVSSNGPVTVHQFNPISPETSFSNDASLVFPVSALGTDYTVLSWPSARDNTNNRTVVSIVAVESGTTNVEVRPSAAVQSGDGIDAMEAGVTRTISLQRGEVLHLRLQTNLAADLSGTRITSNRKVGVFSGHQCANVPLGMSYCDHIETQLLPVNTWGTQMVVARFQPRGTEPEIVRIVASRNGTSLTTVPTQEGVQGRTLAAGEVIEYIVREPFLLTASEPVSAALFMVGSNYGCTGSIFGNEGCEVPVCGTSYLGDPAMTMLLGSHQHLEEVRFLVPSGWTRNHISVVAPRTATITLDGTTLRDPERIGTSDWALWRAPVTAGTRTLVSSRPAAAYVHGSSCDVSYAYPAGAAVRPPQ